MNYKAYLIIGVIFLAVNLLNTIMNFRLENPLFGFLGIVGVLVSVYIIFIGFRNKKIEEEDEVEE